MGFSLISNSLDSSNWTTLNLKRNIPRLISLPSLHFANWLFFRLLNYFLFTHIEFIFQRWVQMRWIFWFIIRFFFYLYHSYLTFFSRLIWIGLFIYILGLKYFKSVILFFYWNVKLYIPLINLILLASSLLSSRGNFDFSPLRNF